MVRYGKPVTYAASSLVVGSLSLFAIDSAFGINTFKFFHEHPGLSVLTGMAHSLVMFMAVSSGIGLAKYRKFQDETERATEKVVQAGMHLQEILEFLHVSLGPLLQLSNAAKSQGEELLSNLPASGTEPDKAMRKLAQQVRSIGLMVEQLNIPNIESAMREGSINRALRALNGLPEMAKRAMTTMAEFIPDHSEKNPQDQLFDRFISTSRALMSAIMPDTPGGPDPQRPVLMNIVQSCLTKLLAQSGRCLRLHHELHERFPKLVSADLDLELGDLCAGLRSLTALVDPDTLGEVSQTTREHELAEIAALRSQAIQLHTRSQDIRLPSDIQQIFSEAVMAISAIRNEMQPSEAHGLLDQTTQLFSQLHSAVKGISPEENPDAKFHHTLRGKIDTFAKKYPKLAIQASFAGFMAGVSYWVSISEAIDSIFPTGGNLYDNHFISAEHQKYVFPFALNTFIVFAAGAVNYKFRPYLVWASLELSHWTFMAVRPFSYLWDTAQKWISARVDLLEHGFLRRRGAPREGGNKTSS